MPKLLLSILCLSIFIAPCAVRADDRIELLNFGLTERLTYRENHPNANFSTMALWQPRFAFLDMLKIGVDLGAAPMKQLEDEFIGFRYNIAAELYPAWIVHPEFVAGAESWTTPGGFTSAVFGANALVRTNFYFLSHALLCFLTACGSPLNLGRGPGQPSSPGADPVPTIVPGMVLYYDAAFVSGSYGVPNSPCGATTWTDLTSYRNDGTIAGFNCTTSSGFTGTGTILDPYRLEFSGSVGKITTSLHVSPSDMASTTWEGWINPSGAGANRQTIFSSDNSGYDRQLLIEPGSDTLAAFTGTGVYQAVPVDFNQWQHVAVTYTPTNIYVYKNGQKYTYPGTPSGMATTNPLTLGANPAFPLEGFNGGIAYLTVYDRALSDAEIS